MSARACPRVWEAEAVRDGRLTGALALDFERHLAGCEACAGECARLERLAQALRALPGDDEVALRRTRLGTLKQAAALMHTEAERAPARPGRGALALGWIAAFALACGIGGFWLERTLGPKRPVIVMKSSEHARFRRNRAPGVERIDLDEGTLSVSVRRAKTDARVVVRVPEGEIEDLGTVFKITVQHGRTIEISVREGIVVFHRRGQNDLRLSAGIVWSPAAPEVEAPRASTPGPDRQRARELPKPARSLGAHPKPTRAAVRDVAAAAEAETIAQTPPVTPQASAPAPAFDPSGEDGAYLRVLALLAEGRAEEARLAAAEYLENFPNGFRRREIERIANRAAAP